MDNNKTKEENIKEEDFKASIFQEYFGTRYKYRPNIDNIDFIITDKRDNHLLWCETKKVSTDVIAMFAQLILTIGKGRTFNDHLPPPFLAVFDNKKIAFIPYSTIQDIFYKNDFNWNVAPSNYETKEFKEIKDIVQKTIDKEKLLFNFESDKIILKEFIKNNFTPRFKPAEQLDLFSDTDSTIRIQIDKNNFIPTYNKWVEIVKPSITIDWNNLKKKDIIDGDFYLADLLSDGNKTLKESLFVLLDTDKYRFDKKIDEDGISLFKEVYFNDNGRAYKQFWNRYKRPPKGEYWEYMVGRRDLLVPPDIRERKGSFFTPQIWVEKAQEYLAAVFGENWQEEYYIWDCAAGTGNLLVGLTNKYNIWASTIDKQDVDIMFDRIKNGANLLNSHVFQFDFLNGSFDDDKFPEGLKEIIYDHEKRKKLIIFINPPYAEPSGYGKKNKSGVSSTKVYSKFKDHISFAISEIFAQFFIRIYSEIDGCVLANFSTLKILQTKNFKKFRDFFLADLKKMFICPSYSFDNVNGQFPIGFMIWDTSEKKRFESITVDVYEVIDKKINREKIGEAVFKCEKKICCLDNEKGYINDWLRNFYDKEGVPARIVSSPYTPQPANIIGYLRLVGPDFQANSGVYFTIHPKESDVKKSMIHEITKNNIVEMSIYLAVRNCIVHHWTNDRDQFLYPNDNYIDDEEFKNDCLIYTIFHSQNRISSSFETNHWIPFTEKEVDSNDKFKSHFMIDFMKGKIFSKEAVDVLNSACDLWRYYHTKRYDDKYLNNASLYDIKQFFKKDMASKKSKDHAYYELIYDLRDKLKILAKKIEPKVYEYGFLKR